MSWVGLVGFDLVWFDLVCFFTLGSSLLFLPPALLWGRGIPCALALALTAPRARRLGRRRLLKKRNTAAEQRARLQHGHNANPALQARPPQPLLPSCPGPPAHPITSSFPQGKHRGKTPAPLPAKRGGKGWEGAGTEGNGAAAGGRGATPPRGLACRAGRHKQGFSLFGKNPAGQAVLWSPGFPAQTHLAGKHIFIYRERERVIFKNEIRTLDTNMFGILFFFFWVCSMKIRKRRLGNGKV